MRDAFAEDGFDEIDGSNYSGVDLPAPPGMFRVFFQRLSLGGTRVELLDDFQQLILAKLFASAVLDTDSSVIRALVYDDMGETVFSTEETHQ